nr:translation initiation factor IF-2-like [Anas platyrhynchos]
MPPGCHRCWRRSPAAPRTTRGCGGCGATKLRSRGPSPRPPRPSAVSLLRRPEPVESAVWLRLQPPLCPEPVEVAAAEAEAEPGEELRALYQQLAAALPGERLRFEHEPLVQPAATGRDLDPEGPQGTGAAARGTAPARRWEPRNASLLQDYLRYLEGTGSDFLHAIFNLGGGRRGRGGGGGEGPAGRGRAGRGDAGDTGGAAAAPAAPAAALGRAAQSLATSAWPWPPNTPTAAALARLPAALAAVGGGRRPHPAAGAAPGVAGGAGGARLRPQPLLLPGPQSLRGACRRGAGPGAAACRRGRLRGAAPGLRCGACGRNLGTKVTLRGRPYEEKMRRDVVEMLYRLQQGRRAGALGAMLRHLGRRKCPWGARVDDVRMWERCCDPPPGAGSAGKYIYSPQNPQSVV